MYSIYLVTLLPIDKMRFEISLIPYGIGKRIANYETVGECLCFEGFLHSLVKRPGF